MKQKELGGWRAANQCDLGARKGSLIVRSTGGDPYLIAVEVPTATGPLTLEWRQRTRVSGNAEVFWGDEQGGFAAERSVRVDYTPDNRWQELRAALPVQGKLAALRLDPTGARGEVELAWLRLRGPSGTVLKEWRFEKLPDQAPQGELPPEEKWAYIDKGKVRPESIASFRRALNC